jgi:serine/threonine protein kinase
MVVRDPKGIRVRLGGTVGEGGEATVYEVAGRPELLAKVYKPPPRADYERKLTWMQENPPDDPTSAQGHTSIAWPLELLYNGQDQFAGYLMYHIQNAVPVLDVFNPRLRARTLPGFNWRYLHRTARNLAVALEALHTRGYVIGDINESNVMVTPTAMVTLIDTDSFQVQVQSGFRKKTYYCPVGKPEYTPPELQGRSLRNTQRYAEQDYFGLGVLIFQLLMGGSHPFRGQWEGADDPPSIEERIRRGAFPYMSSPPLPVVPPRYGAGLEVLHPPVADLVRRCFVDGQKRPRKRPKPREWEGAIREAEKALLPCASGHYFAHHLSSCPWCAATHGEKRAPRALPAQSPVAARSPLHAAGSTLFTPATPKPVPAARPSVRAVPTQVARRITSAVNTARAKFRGAVVQPTRGVMRGAAIGAGVWAVGGAAFGAAAGAIAGVLGLEIIGALVWAVVWATGWWAFGEVLGELIGGKPLGKRIGVCGAVGGALIAGALGWMIRQTGTEEIGSWVVVKPIVQVSAWAVWGDAFGGMTRAALIGAVSGAFIWAIVWAFCGMIGGAVGWRRIGWQTLGAGFGRVPGKVRGTAWMVAGAIEGGAAAAVFGIAIGAIVGGIVGLTGGALDPVPIRMFVGSIIGAIIGATVGTIGADYLQGINEKHSKALGAVEAIVGFAVGLVVARRGLDLWASGEIGISTALEAALLGLVSGALAGAIIGALVGASYGAYVRASEV